MHYPTSLVTVYHPWLTGLTYTGEENCNKDLVNLINILPNLSVFHYNHTGIERYGQADLRSKMKILLDTNVKTLKEVLFDASTEAAVARSVPPLG